jgi:hypothetical protein
MGKDGLTYLGYVAHESGGVKTVSRGRFENG